MESVIARISIAHPLYARAQKVVGECISVEGKEKTLIGQPGDAFFDLANQQRRKLQPSGGHEPSVA